MQVMSCKESSVTMTQGHWGRGLLRMDIGRWGRVLSLLLLGAFSMQVSASEADSMQQCMEDYFAKHFELLSVAVDKQPDEKTFRKVMKPLVEELDEFREATLLDTNYVIRLTYYRRHRMAVGYDLKTVDSLKVFHEKMIENPMPQISGPTKSKLMNPSVIVLRYPILENEKLTGIVSLMVSTESFLDDMKLSSYKAYKISCSDGIEISKGDLSLECERFKVKLPSAEWIVEYELNDQ